MNLTIRQIQNVLRTYGRQFGHRPPSIPPELSILAKVADRVTPPGEGNDIRAQEETERRPQKK